MSRYDDELRALLDEGRSLEGGREPVRMSAPRIPSPPAPPDPAVDLAAEAELARDLEIDLAATPDGPPPPAPTGATGPRGRPTAALQQTWIDDDDVPFTPVVRPGRELPARLFSLAVLGAVLAFLAWMIVPEVSFRVTNIDTLGVRNGVLTAQPVPLASPPPGGGAGAVARPGRPADRDRARGHRPRPAPHRHP